MKLYTARAHGNPDGILIIARSGSHAAAIFATYRAAEDGVPPEAFTIYPNKIPQLTQLEDLFELVRAGVSGIVDFDEESGFSLRPM